MTEKEILKALLDETLFGKVEVDIKSPGTMALSFPAFIFRFKVTIGR
jgi:hypothetical protein